MPVRQVWLWQINFNGRAVGTFSKTNTPAVSCLWTTWTVWMLLILFITFLTSFLLWFVSEIGGMLLLCFPLQQITSYKFMALLATCDLNFPICPSGPKYLTHLAFCFTWFKVLIPRIWIFTSNIFFTTVLFLLSSCRKLLFSCSVTRAEPFCSPFSCTPCLSSSSTFTGNFSNCKANFATF